MKVNIKREMERNLKELGDFLENELIDITTNKIRGMDHRSRKRTVCDVFREIYQTTEDEHIKELTVEGTYMAKRMTKKLVEYSKQVKSDEV